MINKILNYIKKNRVSTTELADCMDKIGVIDNSNALISGHFKVGKTHYCYCDDESNWNVHKNIQNVQENYIVFIDDLGANGRAIYGDIVAKYLILYKSAEAIVSNGKVRDVHTLIKENYPIWCYGTNPVGCFNYEPKSPIDKIVLNERIEYFKDSIIVADDTGAVVITKEFINKEFYAKLEWIERQEDIWFDCIDRKKWNTFDTICLKKYKIK
jgi:4-hydroxy-4-methyl-2-oxoglutarate aldolase